jgi:hypothetical protein
MEPERKAAAPAESPSTDRATVVSLALALAVVVGLGALLAWPRPSVRTQPLAGAGTMLLDEPPARAPAAR